MMVIKLDITLFVPLLMLPGDGQELQQVPL